MIFRKIDIFSRSMGLLNNLSSGFGLTLEGVEHRLNGRLHLRFWKYSSPDGKFQVTNGN